MIQIKQVGQLALVKALVFGVLVLIIASSTGLEPIEAASISQNDTLKLGKSSAITSAIPAFPGAEGFGAQSVGGRGGKVYYVDSLADSGPGTLRECVDATGPRYCLFATGGTIELRSRLSIRNDHITIAGQSAPGGGIALKTHPNLKTEALEIRASDVVIRHLRIRPGPSTEGSCCLDAVSIRDGSNIILDHVSMSWATDETIALWDSKGRSPNNITIQWSVVSEGLRNSTHHDEGQTSCCQPHSMGMMVGRGSGNISVHHNLFAHNNSRNPYIGPAFGVVDFVNNVIYNIGPDAGSNISDEYYGSPVPVNIVGNYQVAGESTRLSRGYYARTRSSFGQLFVEGNITPWRLSSDNSDELKGVIRQEDWPEVVSDRHPAPPISETSANQAFNDVLDNVGATLPQRDSVDSRIVSDVIDGTGRVIDDPSDVDGWPVLEAGTAPDDTDLDGMPDEWEKLYGFDTNNPADSSGDADGDGYTNVEEYLNGTEPGSVPITDPLPLTLQIDGPSSVVPGETFSASVMARNVTGDGLYGVQLEINYDPSLISASNLQVNPNLAFVVLNSADNSSGKISLVASQQGNVSGLTGDITLLTLDATAAETSGTVTFTFENEKLSDPQAQGFDFFSQSHAISIGEVATPEPTDELTPEPPDEPADEPTPEPTDEPTPEPTDEPTPEPTDEPTPKPTDGPTPEPTGEPTSEPTDEPTPEPTDEPTPEPTDGPTPEPTDEPTPEPTDGPTPEPTDEPTPEPTDEPTPEPTNEPAIAVVFGQVILAGRMGNDWSDAYVTIDDSGLIGTTDTDGNFTILDVASGVLDSITVNAHGYLPAVCTQSTIVAPETVLATIALLSGDINDDSLVDIVDATAVGAGFGQTGPDLMPDINRDGILDIFDIVLVSINYGETGPQVWNCLDN